MWLRCAYCGGKKFVPLWWLKLLSLFKSDYFFVCQNCLHYNCFSFYLRVYHNSVNAKEKEANKRLKK